jgi:ketosteroid isomerase-like protein
MKAKLFWPVGIVAAALVATAATARAAGGDQSEIAALEQRIATAVESRNADGVMANYVPGSTLVVFDLIPPREYDGAPAYHKNWQGIFDLCVGPISMKTTDLKVVSDGKIAVGHSLQHFACVDGKGNKIDMLMRTTDGYQKIKGNWLIFHEHNSVPVDLLTAKVDMSSKP